MVNIYFSIKYQKKCLNVEVHLSILKSKICRNFGIKWIFTKMDKGVREVFNNDIIMVNKTICFNRWSLLFCIILFVLQEIINVIFVFFLIYLLNHFMKFLYIHTKHYS